MEGLEEAVAAFDEEQRLEGSTARRTGRWTWRSVSSRRQRPRSGWHKASRGFVPVGTGGGRQRRPTTAP